MKRKLLCVAVALVMILPLAFAAIPFSNATEFEKGGIGDFIHSADTGVGTQYIVNADGSVTMWYGAAGVTGANLGLTYAGALTQGTDYSGAVYFMIPETNASFTHGCLLFGIGVSGENWVSNTDLIVKVIDYSTHPTVGLGTEANLGKCFEMLDCSAGIGVPVGVGCNTGITYADCDIKDYGEWNLFSFEVHGGLADLYINGVCILENYALAGVGTGFCIGTNGDSGEAAEGHATFKELILTKGLDTATYFPSETVDLPFDIIAQCAGNTEGTISVNGDGDITLGCNTGWWGSAGIVTTEKVPIDGITITFNKSVFTDASPNGYFGILVSKNKPTTYSVQMMTRAYAPDVKASQSLMLCVNGQSAGAYGAFTLEGTCGTIAPRQGGGYADTNGDDVTVSFSPVYTKWVDVSGTMKSQKFVRVYVNGESLTYRYDANAEFEDEDWYEPDWRTAIQGEINVSKVVDADNMVYLSLTAQGYGGSGGTVVVKDISFGDDAKIAPTVIGAQYRTTGEPGLRFATTIEKGAFYDNANIDHYGTLILPANCLDDLSQLVHTDSGTIKSAAAAANLQSYDDSIGVEYLDIVANNLYKQTGWDITFTAVLIGIPDNDRQFVARGYIAYEDGTIVYAAPIVRSINDVIAASELDALNA